MVEEHPIVGRSIIERICGRNRRENAGISSESKVRILAIESLRFPGEGSSAQGKSGPKERPKSVSDGQQVEIPALPKYLKDVSDTGEEDKRGRGKTRIERYSEKYSNELSRITLTRKAYRYCIKVPVPQTDTGR